MTVDPHLPETPLEKSAISLPRSERTAPLLAAFLLIAAFAMTIAFFTVHDRQPGELAAKPGSQRSHVVLTHWLNEGYFHYLGLINRDAGAVSIYRNSTGGYMVSGFIVEKLYSTIFGHYSYRLLALHNQVVSMFISALAGLLAHRLARRFQLEPRLAFTAGAAVVLVVFTFPDNLDLYWEMSAQACGLLFALIFLLVEERGLDDAQRSRRSLLAQAASVFAMTVMESIVALGFVAAVGATFAVLRRDGSWRRFLLVVALPFFAAFGLYQLQLKAADARFPNVPTTGSKMMWRTGFDGEALYYADHLDIAKRRDWARGNWPAPNRESLFRWTWVFVLGLVSIAGILIAFLRDRAPRLALESMAWLIGAWLLYAGIFSQAVLIHPYLYDVLLFTPLCLAVFAIGPSLLESLTKRTGAILLVVLFSAVWYSLFQMRLYALRWPIPKPPIVS